MQLTHKGKVYAAILFASAFFTLSTLTFGFFPHLGLSVAFIIFSCLAYYIKKDKTTNSKSFFLITVALSSFLAIRSEEFITLLNLFGLIYFGSLFLSIQRDEKKDNIFTLALAPVILILRSLFSTSDYNLEFKDPGSKNKDRESALNSVAIGLTTIIALAIILPLLASANPFFKNILMDIVNLLGLNELKVTESIIQWIIRLLVFVVLVFNVPRMATVANKKQDFTISFEDGLNMLIPKIAVTIVLTIFFVTQLQLYFASPETLSDMGYTLSRLTNEVFGQLSAVAAIILVLLYGEKMNKKTNNIMTLVLVIQGIFLTLMAYKSDFDYINAWGFTYKRLYGLAVATWILGIFIIYLITFLRGISKSTFLIRSLIYTGIILFFINLANFDYLIYHYRRATTGEGVDREYLARLSGDSLSYKNQLNQLISNNADTPTDVERLKANSEGLPVLFHKIERLQKKYRNLDVRGFNFLEYKQYLDIKDVDIQKLRERYTPF